MPFERPATLFPVVTGLNNPTIPVGQVVYLQDGIKGSPRGLLLALTYTAKVLSKNIQTVSGLQVITY